jgi:hypothetical protein
MKAFSIKMIQQIMMRRLKIFKIQRMESNFVPLLDEEIFIAIRKLKNKMSPGPDKITNENIKTLISSIILPHTAFLNICLEKRDFPEGWKYSKI